MQPDLVPGSCTMASCLLCYYLSISSDAARAATAAVMDVLYGYTKTAPSHFVSDSMYSISPAPYSWPPPHQSLHLRHIIQQLLVCSVMLLHLHCHLVGGHPGASTQGGGSQQHAGIAMLCCAGCCHRHGGKPLLSCRACLCPYSVAGCCSRCHF
jgi:hypothetical protein